MNFDLSLTQEQKLVMTQNMQLSVKLLQMSSLELGEYLDKELQENPVLELSLPESKKEDKDKEDYKELVKYLEFDNYSHESNYNKDDEEVSPFNFIAQEKSLKDYLNEEISYCSLNKFQKTMCRFIIENIDERGYLCCSTEDISKELMQKKEFIDECLSIVQDLDPPGIAARDLKECLKLQLWRMENDDPLIFLIIDDYLEEIAGRKFSKISKELNIPMIKVQEYFDKISKLEPRPSRGFYTGENTGYVVPDAYIKKYEDDYIILMNEDALPKLSINSTYKNIILNEKDENTVNYVKEKINNALFLISSIEKRKSTIYKILEQIIKEQREFLDHGEDYLKPMTLKEMAEKIGVHESTVSRAVKDKYVSIDRGIIRLKDLFTKGINTSSSNNNGEVSSKSIKNIIEKLILNEDKKRPLSDQQLSQVLINEGFEVARRTVAKYREELNILSSSKRKRF